MSSSFNIIEGNNGGIAEVISDKLLISEVQDALDLMAECDYRGARRIIIKKENIIPDFFDLKTGIAGEILQRFSTYDMRLAILGDFSKYESRALRDFIYESNKAGRILFVPDRKVALERLAHNYLNP